MPYTLSFESVTVDGDTEIVLSGTKDVRIMSAVNTPRIIGISNPGDAVLIGVQNFAGVSVPFVHNSGSASQANRKLLMNGLGGDWSLKHGQAVRVLSVDPNIDPGTFADSLRGWYVDNRGLEDLLRFSTTASTSSPTESGSTPVTVPEMTSGSVATVGGLVVAVFTISMTVQPGDAGTVQFYVDGSPVGDTLRNVSYSVSLTSMDVTHGFGASVAGLAAGSHTFDVRWAASGGSMRANGLQRRLDLFEIHP